MGYSREYNNVLPTTSAPYGLNGPAFGQQRQLPYLRLVSSSGGNTVRSVVLGPEWECWFLNSSAKYTLNLYLGVPETGLPEILIISYLCTGTKCEPGSINLDNIAAEISSATTAGYASTQWSYWWQRIDSTAAENDNWKCVESDEPGAELIVKRTDGIVTGYEYVAGKGRNGPSTVLFDANGKFVSETYAGAVNSVTFNSNGTPSEKQSVIGSTTLSLVFTYYTSGDSSGLLQSVLLRRKDGSGSWQPIRQAAYTYWSNSDTNGNGQDLKLATVQIPDGSGGWTDVAKNFYTYYNGTNGPANCIKYVISNESYARMAAASIDPATASDTTLATYAEHYFQYDSSRRVTYEKFWKGVDQFSYSSSSFTLSGDNTAADANTWMMKTTVTHGDSTADVFYTNTWGQIMLALWADGRKEFLQYDAMGRGILHALDSAIDGYSESQPGLLTDSSGTYTHLKDTSGYIGYNKYSDGIIPSNGPEGFLISQGLRNGKNNTSVGDVPLHDYHYVTGSFTAPATSVLIPTYQLQQDVSYPDASTSVATTYSYTWPSNSPVPLSRATTRPVVTGDQNGSDTATQVDERFDAYGNLIWRKDRAGSSRTCSMTPCLIG